MGRLFRSVFGFWIVFLAAFVWGGCSGGGAKKTTGLYPQGCVVVDGAKILKYSPSKDAKTPTLLAYSVEEPYPASRTIGTITKELVRRGWKAIDYLKEIAPPGEQTLPMNQWVDTKGMPGFAPQGRSSVKKAWPGYWKGPKGEMALYQLTYSLPPGSDELSPEVTVVIRYASAEVATNIREEDRKLEALIGQWDQGKISQEDWQRQAESLGAKTETFAKPKDFPSTGSRINSGDSPEYQKLEREWMVGMISAEEFKQKAARMGVIVGIPRDDSPLVDPKTLPPKDRELMEKFVNGEISEKEYSEKENGLLALPGGTITIGTDWGAMTTPAPVPMFGSLNNPPEYYPLEKKWLNGELSDQEFFRKLKDMGIEVKNPTEESPTPVPQTSPTPQVKSP